MLVFRFRLGILAAVTAASLAGCGRNLRTAQDPFLEEQIKMAGKNAPRQQAPPGSSSADKADGADPFLAGAKPSSRTPGETKTALADSAPRGNGAADKSPNGKPASGARSSSTVATLWDDPFASVGPAPSGKEKPPARSEEKPAVAKEDSSENPFTATDSPTLRLSQQRAAPFPGAEDDEIPFAASPSKSRLAAKPAAPPASLAGDLEESPFEQAPAAAAKAPPKAAATDPWDETDTPLVARKAPPPPKVQSPESEEFEENPFAPPPVDRKPKGAPPVAAAALPVAAVAPAAAADAEDSDAPSGKVRISDDSLRQTSHVTERRATPYRRYRPMPAQGEAGWKPRASDDEPARVRVSDDSP